MEQHERLPVAAVPQENIRAIRANPLGFKAREKAAIGRQ
jgi:hypothetical protein